MNLFKPMALCFLVGCVAPSDEAPRDEMTSHDPPSYGVPNDATAIHLLLSGGYSPRPSGLEVRIQGTAATYRFGDTTEHATVAVANVAEIIYALEAVEFLALDADYSTCDAPATDAPSATIEVAVSAGVQKVDFYSGCSGGVFDDLSFVTRQISTLSGLSGWFEQIVRTTRAP